ncbi:Uncharacterized protein HZ326_31214 [Fusarium oxysporum f. sp. albedinis]|nr:Uncharacterized protein HZ326_31214 [Fusarium oxysporum f. sp. albedinis]
MNLYSKSKSQQSANTQLNALFQVLRLPKIFLLAWRGIFGSSLTWPVSFLATGLGPLGRITALSGGWHHVGSLSCILA